MYQYSVIYSTGIALVDHQVWAWRIPEIVHSGVSTVSWWGFLNVVALQLSAVPNQNS